MGGMPFRRIYGKQPTMEEVAAGSVELEVTSTSSKASATKAKLLLCQLHTKNTPLQAVRYSRTNLLMAAGPYLRP